MLNVLFHAFNLGHRGGTNSLRDYAIHNEKILGNRSTILYHTNGHQASEPDVIESLSKQFEIIPVATNREVDALVKPYDVVYSQRFCSISIAWSVLQLYRSMHEVCICVKVSF